MLRQRPDLIVPIRDRRQRKRYLTLKNFLIVFGAALGLFVAISTYSELRGLRPGEFGSLVRRELPKPVEPKPIEVVAEEPPAVSDATHADPMLMEPAVRAQWLQDDSATTTTTTPVVPVTAAAVTRGDADVVIVGGPDGVTVAKRERRRPLLSGGFGRQ